MATRQAIEVKCVAVHAQFPVGRRIVLICDRLRSDDLVDSQAVLAEVTLNDGYCVEWTTVEAMECENVLRPMTNGGFSLRSAADMMARGDLRDETGAFFDGAREA